MVKALKITSSVLIGLILVVVFLLMGTRLIGFEPYTVLSGSMEPEFPTGSMTYVRSVDTASLAVGDVITFRMAGGDTVATHRIIEVITEDSTLQFRTKGDANDGPDHNLVPADRVIGSPSFTIPYLGRFASFLQERRGKAVSIAVVSGVILMVVASELLAGRQKNQDDPEETV